VDSATSVVATLLSSRGPRRMLMDEISLWNEARDGTGGESGVGGDGGGGTAAAAAGWAEDEVGGFAGPSGAAGLPSGVEFDEGAIVLDGSVVFARGGGFGHGAVEAESPAVAAQAIAAAVHEALDFGAVSPAGPLTMLEGGCVLPICQRQHLAAPGSHTVEVLGLVPTSVCLCH